MSENDAKSTIDKMTPEQKIKAIASSPMPQVEKGDGMHSWSYAVQTRTARVEPFAPTSGPHGSSRAFGRKTSWSCE
jgi:hypothetical protein